MTQLCPCHRHGYHPDVYYRCAGGVCGHPCDRDSRVHQPCEDLAHEPRSGADRHSCGCLSPQEMRDEAVALLTGLLTKT